MGLHKCRTCNQTGHNSRSCPEGQTKPNQPPINPVQTKPNLIEDIPNLANQVNNGTYTWFARIRSFDLVCPQCDEMYIIVSNRNRNIDHPNWDRSRSIFTCKRCGWRAVLGILAWETGPVWDVKPIDVVPSVRQSGRLRTIINRMVTAKAASAEFTAARKRFKANHITKKRIPVFDLGDL